MRKPNLPTPEPYSDPNEPETAISYRNLRLAIGVLALALPIVLPIGKMMLNGGAWPDSISAYYYTHMADYFVGTMWAIGVFLVFYRYAPRDNLYSTVLGILALLISVCPTDHAGATTGERVLGGFHLCFAAAFLLGLAGFSWSQFTRTDGQPTAQKKRRNTIYRSCAAVIVLGVILGGISVFAFSVSFAHRWHPLFWSETVAVLAFAAAWLVKGGLPIPGLTEASDTADPYATAAAAAHVSVEPLGGS